MNRPAAKKRNVVAFALALAVTVIGCTSETWGCGMGAACPAMADVSGVRYAVSGAEDFVGIEAHLQPFARISQSNMSAAFADDMALAVDGVDPNVFVVVRNLESVDEPGAFRGLWSLADDPFPVGLCRFISDGRRAAYPACE